MKQIIKSILLLTFFTFTLSCTTEKDSFYLIKGYISNFKADKIYLSSTSSWNVFLDSAEVKNGQFLIKLNRDKHEPFIGQLLFKDSKAVSGYSGIYFHVKNKYFNGFLSAFFLGDAPILISGDIEKKDLKIQGGVDNYLYHSFFGSSIDNMMAKNPQLIYDLIKRYPDSYYLLDVVYNNRIGISPSQISYALSLFSKKMLHLDKFNELKGNTRLCIDISSTPLPSIELSDSSMRRRPIFEKNKVNIIVFWASWCKPCREEIPLLKSVYKDYKQQVNFTSISIDDAFQRWKYSLNLEQPTWTQLFANATESKRLKWAFNFNAIPLIVITDKNLRVVKKFEGTQDSALLAKSLDEIL